ncbi:hypothetical protein [Anaerobacillus alkaliphilus]|uniref:hypothetical protein n=1 Tax=Anaerobacillus alkaliphilus TaxID=1548597 RepID=UPI001375A858|nr:hypothetical protein [Anaerobacillus alkaliphilus]
MLENIVWINVIYQLLIFIVWIGIIFFIASLFRSSIENKKRLKRLEEKIDSLIEK